MECLMRLERMTLTSGGLRSNPTELQAHLKLFYLTKSSIPFREFN